MKINVNNEYGKLKKVLICSPKGFIPPDYAIDPQTMAAIKNGTLPTAEALINEQVEYTSVIKKHGAEIIYADVVPDAIDQMFTRDPYAAVGGKLLICNMKETGRKKELHGIKKVLKSIDQSKVIFVPDNAIVEGGDVVVHNDTIFVGQGGLRTDAKGLEFIKRTFGDTHNVVPINLTKSKSGIDMLHLDCALNPLGKEALVYADGIDDKSMGRILDNFNPIWITETEQFQLGTNVLSLGNKTVVAQKRHSRIIGELEKSGYTVEPVDFSQTAKLGGAFRCTTCPIEREPN